MSTCSIAGCERNVTARGMCRMHYLREWRAGTVQSKPTRDRSRHECPDSHAHDLETCWAEHGCRCDRCQHLRRMERQRHRSRMKAYGRPYVPVRVPVQPVRAHLIELQNHGLGLERIADAAQVSRSIVLEVYYGPRGAAKRHMVRDASERTVRASHATRILAVRPEHVAASFVAATGTVRRLRALVAVGYTQTHLAERLGMQVTNLSHLILGRRRRVTAATYEATCEMFADLWADPPSGARADRARALAKSRRWVGPLAWDDIDDPDERPNVRGGSAEATYIDELAVELAIAGESVRLTPAERREAITRLHAERWSDARIAERIGCATETVQRIRADLGLEAFDYADLEKRGAA